MHKVKGALYRRKVFLEEMPNARRSILAGKRHAMSPKHFNLDDVTVSLWLEWTGKGFASVLIVDMLACKSEQNL